MRLNLDDKTETIVKLCATVICCLLLLKKEYTSLNRPTKGLRIVK